MGRWREKLAVALTLVAAISLVAQVAERPMPAGEGKIAKTRPRLQVQSSHEGGVSRLAFSNDGKWLVTAGYDGIAILWDIATGREIHAFRGHTSPIYAMTISHDSKWLVTGGPDTTIRLWDLATGKEVRVFKGHTHEVRSLSMSSDGRWLASSAYDETARLWDVAGGKEVRVFKQPQLNRAVLSGDGKRLVSVSSDSDITLWDAATGAQVRSFALSYRIWSLDLSEDGKTLALAGEKQISLWDLGTGKMLRTFQSGGHDTISLSADGKRLAAASHGGGVALWDTQTGKELPAASHQSWVTDMSMSRDGKRMAIAELKSFHVQVLEDGKHLRWIGRGPAVRTGAAMFSNDGKWLLTANQVGDPMVIYDRAEGTQFRVWDLTKGAEVRILKSPGLFGGSAILTSDAKCVLTRQHSAAELWDLKTGEKLREFEHDGIDHLAVSADGKWLATSARKSSDKKNDEDRHSVRLWDVESGKLLRTIEKTGWVNSLAISADKKWLVTGKWEGEAVAWDLSSEWKHLSFHAHPRGFHFCVAVTSDNKYLVTGGTDRNPRLWDLKSGAELRTFYGHESVVRCLTLSPDDKSLITGSKDGTVRFWDLATAKTTRIIAAHFGEVASVSLTGDGKRLVTASHGESPRIWDVASGKELCRTVSFADGDWAVYDSENRIDSSKADLGGIYWVTGTESFPLQRFRDQYHDAGLLAKYMGFNMSELRKMVP